MERRFVNILNYLTLLLLFSPWSNEFYPGRNEFHKKI